MNSVTRLDDGVNIWFTFWGTYIGALFTGVLSIYAIQLNAKFDVRNKKNARIQMALDFHQFQIKEVQLYDLDRGLPVREIEKFPGMLTGRYILKIIFFDLFPPYFNVEIKSITWKNKKNKDVNLEMDKVEYVVENNQSFIIYCLILEDTEIIPDVNEFYHINYFCPEIMADQERSRWIYLRLECENQMHEEKPNNSKLNFGLSIKVENVTHYDNDFALLKVVDRKLEYKGESEENKYD